MPFQKPVDVQLSKFVLLHLPPKTRGVDAVQTVVGQQLIQHIVLTVGLHVSPSMKFSFGNVILALASAAFFA